MYRRGIAPGSYIYDHLLQSCLDVKALPQAKLIHAQIILTGFITHHIVLSTKLVITYAKCGALLDARRLFEQMPQRSVVSWTAMIAAYAKLGHYRESLALFYRMQRSNIQPNQFTFTTVLPVCANLVAPYQGREIHRAIIRSGLQSDVFVGSALVDMYAKCGWIDDARKLFDKMPIRDVVLWNAMIAGYGQNGYVDEAFDLFQKAPERNVVSCNSLIAGFARHGYIDEACKLFQKSPERNVVSWNAMIAGFAQNGQVVEALDLFHDMPERNVVSWTGMIAGYAQNGYIDEALKLFEKMPERNVVSWNAMISGHTRKRHFEEALKLFWHMQPTAVKPNLDTFTSVLSACANLAALGEGKEIHDGIIRDGFHSVICVGNALVDMYAKCGSLDDARQVFDKMPRRDMVSWTAIIVGYAMHGFGKEALQLFEQMQHSGTKPDHVTFVGVLSACCHAGLVNEGRQYFNCMSRDYHLTPSVEHYCCMVDLLGRAGLLDEAHDFINQMPVKPDAAVWGSLLGACRIHTNVQLGELVADRLFESDPKNAAHYVLLSNIYAAAGRWDGVEKMRKMMKDRRVKKVPGHSWIEVNDMLYSFHVGDGSRPQM